MSTVATAWARTVAKENPALLAADKRTLMCLSRAHTVKNGCSDRSYSQIASETMDCIRTVKSSIARLVAFGLIDKQSQRKGNRQGANRYFLNFGVLMVQNCTLKTTVSGCNQQTPEVVHPLHSEKNLQGATTAPPYAHARAHFGRNRGFQGASLKVGGGRHA